MKHKYRIYVDQGAWWKISHFPQVKYWWFPFWWFHMTWAWFESRDAAKRKILQKDPEAQITYKYSD